MTFSSSNVKKFLFDVSFDEPEVKKADKTANIVEEEYEFSEEVVQDEFPVEEETAVEIVEEPPEPTFTQKELDEATATSFALGEAAGIKKNSQSVAALQIKVGEQIAEGLKKVVETQTRNHEDVLQKALMLAVAITKKIIPTIASKHGIEEVEELIRKYLPQINKEKITIKVNPEQKHSVDMKIYDLSKDANFDGVINVVDDTAVLSGDCRIMWDNGEIEKSTKRILEEIDDVLKQNVPSQDVEVKETSTVEDNQS
ncbi:MAG: FliH/SctL family protein [Alphaproteobacteria bacterium]